VLLFNYRGKTEAAQALDDAAAAAELRALGSHKRLHTHRTLPTLQVDLNGKRQKRDVRRLCRAL